MCNLDTNETNLDGVEAIIRGFIKKFEEGNGQWNHWSLAYASIAFLFFKNSEEVLTDFVFLIKPKQNKSKQ